MKWVVSWSGGKDSCLACYKALSKGKRVSFLLNMVSREYQRCSAHGVPREVIKGQAEAVGIPIVQQEFSVVVKDYEVKFKEALNRLKEIGSGGLITGDIYLEEHRQWLVKVCEEMGFELFMPLWGMDEGEIIEQFISCGFEAIIVCVRADLLGAEFLGRWVDRELFFALKEMGIDLCGERGEYHTFVKDGPLFQKRIEIKEGQRVLRDGYWFLDIAQYEVVEK